MPWKYRPNFDTGISGTSISMWIHADLVLALPNTIKNNSIKGQHAVPGQEHQEQQNHDSVVPQQLTDTEGQVNCFTPITKCNKYIFLLSPDPTLDFVFLF